MGMMERFGRIADTYVNEKEQLLGAEEERKRKLARDKLNKKIIIEPGRYLVGDSGVLITKILFKKSNQNKNFLIVDAGMNTLVRPAMYNAYHEIEEITKKTDETMNYTVAGPICESSDIFVKNIHLTKQSIGDILIIKNTGAYGKVMSSTYNTRALPTEVLINGENFAIIYAPDKIEKNIEEDIIPSWL